MGRMTEKRFKVNADYLNNLDSIIDNETGIEHDYLEIEELLNGLNDENEQSKMMIATLRNIVLENEDLEKENKELKDFKEKVFDLIDENIKYYRKYSTLTVKMPMDCKYRKSCLDNHSINVGNKAKENAYQKLKKELSE